ncbi:MAG: response regulator [Desulfobacter sp.]|nr:MAG: response regulator [Desulfobacter sp.]
MDKPKNNPPQKGRFHESARRKFLALGMETTRKSYYPQLKAQLENARRDKRRLQLLIDSLPAQISYIDAEERFILVNRSFEAAFKLDRAEIIGSRMKKILGNKIYSQTRSHIEQALSGRSGRFEYSLSRGGSAEKHYAIHYVPEKEESGQITSFYVMTIDVTEKKEAEKEKSRMEAVLHQAQKMEAIGTLSGGIAHDFNNILSGMFGYSQLIDLHAENPEKVRANNQKIMEGARRAADLVRQILTFSRKTEYSRQPLYLSAILKEALKLLRSTIPVTIEIKTDIQSRAMILADATQIHQVIMNLCTNAYHAMGDKGGTLSIGLKKTVPKDFTRAAQGVKETSQYLCLEVKDTGPGIPPDIKDRIFDPYFTTKEQNKGTGLGLAIVNGIVEKHEGFIEFDTHPETGTQFRLYFPIHQARAGSGRERPATPAAAPPKAAGNIMVVDDEPPITSTLSAILSRQGYRVTPFEDGESALASFAGDPAGYDLVITDMTMPGMTGDRLARRLLEIRPDVPIILCTGYHEKFTEAAAREAGIARYLQKPVIGPELSAVIQELLNGA